MGKLLAQNNDVSRAWPDNSLGAAQPTTTGTGGGNWWQTAANVAPDLINTIGGFFGGGGGCSSADKQKRQSIQSLISKHLTPQDRSELVAMANSNISPTPREMANFEVGGVNKWGGDCKHENIGSGDKKFRRQLKKRIQQRQSEADAPPGMDVSTGDIPPAVKYSGVALGVLGAGAAGYYGYQELKN